MSPQNNTGEGAPAAAGASDAPGPHREPRGDDIPVLDLAHPDRAQLVAQLDRACSTWGFFQVVNHGLSPALVAAFRAAMARFFALPRAAKATLRRHADNARGYFDDELTQRKRDWKEALDVGVPGGGDWEDADGDAGNAGLDGYNRFPAEEDCPGFRDIVVRYFEECAALSHRLAVLMTRALSGGEGAEAAAAFVARLQEDHTSYLRLNYYPPAAAESDGAADRPHENSFSHRAAAGGALGISPHRDAGFLTVLLQDDDCHSLQVARDDDARRGDDRWVTVRPVPGALTINTGDMAMLCSNGRFRAPLHRVLTAATRRYSAPFFYNPGYGELIAPFAGCHRPEGEGDGRREDGGHDGTAELPALKYHPCLWGYFRAVRFAGDLTDLGVEIQTSDFEVGAASRHLETQRRFREVVDFAEPFDVEKHRHILDATVG